MMGLQGRRRTRGFGKGKALRSLRATVLGMVSKSPQAPCHNFRGLPEDADVISDSVGQAVRELKLLALAGLNMQGEST